MAKSNRQSGGGIRIGRMLPNANAPRLLFAVAFSLFLGAHAEVLTPPYFNLAEGRKITATATCGDEGQELYCKLVGANAQNDININVIQGQVCDVCDLNSPSKRHPPEHAVDGMETWWQSPPLSRGMKYNEVNLTIDLGQEFHVAYVFVRMGNSPRPGMWILEKSSDYGKTFTPWQYFSDSASDCETYFGKQTLYPITQDDSVICNTEYSKIVPLEGGEIPISLLNNRPSANMYFNSSVLQEWTRATNVRLRLLRTKTLLGHLMSVARQDPTVTRRYFYSIKDISIGGRCMCNGHADTCDIPDPVDPNKLQCRCQHNTCGPQCEQCCPGYEQKKWRQSQLWQKFVCEACNCFNHSNECEYDAEVDAQHLSLDRNGRYEGGGVCKNCQHNTEGINCNKCRPKFYRPHDKKWDMIDVCQPCDCDYDFSTGNCAESTGKCECRKEFQSPYCDSCSYGYFDYPNCKPCICNLNGTDGDYCEPIDGSCPCKSNYQGSFCEICSDGYYNFPKCEECGCNAYGAISPACEQETGNCICRNNFAGRTCERCEAGYYDYPTCKYCSCDPSGTLPAVCDSLTGSCLCKEGFGGPRCDQCISGYYSELRDREKVCVECQCSSIGSTSTSCDATGKCICLHNFVGKRCDKCTAGYYKYPECLPCGCDSHGSTGMSCDELGQCYCKGNFDNLQCSTCRESFYNYPICEECNCDPNGVIQSFAGCGSVPAGELCQCKERVQGRICDECRPLYWNLQQSNALGCQECECDSRGTQGGIGTCDMKMGQCSCKYSVGKRACNECEDGSFGLRESNIFGCTDCGCNIGGSVNNICNKETGQCACRPRIDGLQCDKPLKAHYFPTLHQLQYEVEDGYTPSGNPVRYAFSQEKFPGFSWKGYAVFSLLQNEVLQNIHVQKSSVYQMVLRYVNPNVDPIIGKITITPENPNETEQRFDVLLKPSMVPRFVTVAGSQGVTPSPFVINPGRWTVSIMTDKSLLLDYFVWIPAAYYEATVLLQDINTPCVVGDKGLCNHYGYPNITSFNSVQGAGGYVSKKNERGPITQFIDEQQVAHYNENDIPLINDKQDELMLELTVSKPGSYVLLIEYVTPYDNGDNSGGIINIDVRSDNSQNRSKVFLNSCPYTSICRHVVLDENKRVQVFKIPDNYVGLTVKGEPNTTVGLKSIVAIPYSEWHSDFIKPQPVCIRKNGKCLQSEFPSAPDSKKVEFESATELPTKDKPAYIYDNATELVFLSGDSDKDYIDLNSKVPYPGKYVFIVQYYQPNYPESKMEAIIQNGNIYEGILPIKHCPSNSGCRSVIQTVDGNNRFSLIENFVVTLKGTPGNEMWLDYLLIVPANQYFNYLLEENKLDQTREFISTCGSDHFHINITEEGFCRDAVFALTADYNNGGVECKCDYAGSLSFECDAFGGQCHCKPNIIGRQCEICKTGFFGFPNCKPCDCPSTALCEKDTGECICPTRVTGEKCDQCTPLTYGFDPIIGCEDCNCDPLGVENNLQCDLLNGSCTCKQDVVGRTCDKCAPGHYQFPDCEPCDCDPKGSTIDICDQDSASCYCKSNVVGSACEICKDGTFDLREENDAGCTKCFCFGKTTRCNSANLYWSQIKYMRGWALFNIAVGDNVTISQYSSAPKNHSESAIIADLSNDIDSKNTVYFAAPNNYLDNRLTSYGGFLKYSLLYTTGPFGNAISHADVILEGADNWLLHSGIEQPPENTQWKKNLSLVESEFTTLTGLPATRELLMTALENLQGIYIRATYWEASVTTRLQDVSLDYGNDIWSKGQEPATSIEECQCPANYKGTSCEECAEGYYRVQSGSHGGICIPCQCNGHATSCDVDTGICQDCQHATTGDHCEMCIEGYHGNATIGTPNDCLICACPLPVTSNNFATGCRVSPDGESISCDCLPGYFGARCESCASGFYGRPEALGDFCKECQCSGNINKDDPSSCDTVTGDCLKCMNYTGGEGCSLCQPGYYGDAIVLKDCQLCICDVLGMQRCNSYTGMCECKKNIVGDKCDRCEVDHWGFESGNGCTECNCGVASHSKQCDDETGQCKCMPGVTGKQCNKCAPGFWNYTPTGCITCGCNTEYSHGFGCNAKTGHCECLPGVVGDKCDSCPYRNVLDPELGCTECDSCIHDLLNSTDQLEVLIDPIMIDFNNKAFGYFTAQRLVYIHDKVNYLNNTVSQLDPEIVDLNDIGNNIDELELKTKNLNRTVDYAINDSKKIKNNAGNLTQQCEKILDKVKEGSLKSNAVVQQIKQLSTNLVTGQGQRIDSALAEAEQILLDIKDKEFDSQSNASQIQYNNAKSSYDKIGDFMKPVSQSDSEMKKVKNTINKYNNDLDDLLNISDTLQTKIDKALKLNNVVERIKDVKDKVDLVNVAVNNSDNNLKNATELLKSSNKYLDEIKANLITAQTELTDGFSLNNEVEQTVNDRDNQILPLENLMERVDKHAATLLDESNNLQDLLQSLTNNTETENAVRAASAYSDIVKEINEALENSEDAKIAANNASLVNDAIAGSIEPSKNKSEDLHRKALEALKVVQGELKPKLDYSEGIVNQVKNQNQESDNENNAISSSIPDLPYAALGNFKDIIDDNSTRVGTISKEVLQVANNTNTKLKLDKAKNVSKEMHDVLNDVTQIENQLNRVASITPNVTMLADDITEQQDKFKDRMNNLEMLSQKIEEAVTSAKDIANQIKVGVQFNTSSVLQLPVPENIEDMGMLTHVSAYFNTFKNNGCLMYLGNPKSTKQNQKSDFMVLEIENGYPLVTIDLGNGSQTFRSDKRVSDNVWYHVIFDRVGENVNLIVREELANGTINSYNSSGTLTGNKNILNLNQEQSKLFVGGLPSQVQNSIQDNVRFSSFEGQIEDLVIGDKPVGLWNYVDASHEKASGAFRDKFLISDSVGFHFDGNGYLIMNKDPTYDPSLTEINLSFNTFAEDGLLYLIGNNHAFLSIELRQGYVIFQYRLENDVVTIGSRIRYNDGEWHTVSASRDCRMGKLQIDNDEVWTGESQDESCNLDITDVIYIGGYPEQHHFDEVTNVDFDGCINSVTISRSYLDLNAYSRIFGVKSGCYNKLNMVSLKSETSGYVQKLNISIPNKFELSIRFKTTAKEGLIFYATDALQKTGISLSLVNGALVLISQRERLTTGLTTYNDNQWHTVTITHNNAALKMSIDDYYEDSTDRAPPELRMMYGELFIGGVGSRYIITPGGTASKKSFVGCLGDVIVNGVLVDFSNVTDEYQKTFQKCSKDSRLVASSIGQDQVPRIPNLESEFSPRIPPRKKEETQRLPTTMKPAVQQTPAPVVPVRPQTTKPPPQPQPSVTKAPKLVSPESRPRPAPTIEEDGCALAHDPIKKQWDPAIGYRFGTRQNSCIEFDKLPDRFQSTFTLSVDFNTTDNGGLIFYASDATKQNFITLFMDHGQISFALHYDTGTINLKSENMYNDGNWHNVEFKKMKQIANLLIDGEVINEAQAKDLQNPIMLNAPYFYGGVHNVTADIKKHLEVEYSPFKGCLKNLQLNHKPIEKIKARVNVLPCISNIEQGVYFRPSGGYLRVVEKFKVGVEATISLEIKSRNSSGLLVAVHGRRDYLILEIVDNAVILRVDNGKGPFEAFFKPGQKNLMCDGNWHTIQAVKSRNVVTLGIDGHFSEAGVGLDKPSTDTKSALFIGGHPNFHRGLGKLNGAKVRHGFSGCMKNLQIKNAPVDVSLINAHGDVHVGVCPTD